MTDTYTAYSYSYSLDTYVTNIKIPTAEHLQTSLRPWMALVRRRNTGTLCTAYSSGSSDSCCTCPSAQSPASEARYASLLTRSMISPRRYRSSLRISFLWCWISCWTALWFSKQSPFTRSLVWRWSNHSILRSTVLGVDSFNLNTSRALCSIFRSYLGLLDTVQSVITLSKCWRILVATSFQLSIWSMFGRVFSFRFWGKRSIVLASPAAPSSPSPRGLSLSASFISPQWRLVLSRCSAFFWRALLSRSLAS